MIPRIIRPFLWFNDLKKMDVDKDKDRIILNVLEYGNPKSTKWIFKKYKKEDIVNAIIKYGAKGQLSPKSLNYWKIMLDIDPKELNPSRF